ncbi:MAG TPA: GDSL-type esterase/lipase family protein [Vicinamibacteria bacterium]|jgi:lysophospholipase L1-like esterase
MRAVVRLVLAVALLSGSISVLYGQATQQEAPRTIEPDRFAEAFEEFAAEDKASPPPEGAIVVTGSSSVRRWHPTIKEDLAPLTVIPRGFGGSTMEDALYWIDKAAIQYKPRAIVVYEGDNDTGSYKVPAAKIAEQFEAIVAKIHAALPETRVYVISVKPSVSRWATWPEAVKTNQLLEAIAEKNDRVTYIDVATPMLQPKGDVMTDIFVDDNLHLNPKGYEIWSAAIKEPLMQGEAQYEKAAAEMSMP